MRLDSVSEDRDMLFLLGPSEYVPLENRQNPVSEKSSF
jgi:hypothetical protein